MDKDSKKIYDGSIWGKAGKRRIDIENNIRYLKENGQKKCYQCGRINPKSNKFCGECGCIVAGLE